MDRIRFACRWKSGDIPDAGVRGASAAVDPQPSLGALPVWSRDGKWIYFVSHGHGRVAADENAGRLAGKWSTRPAAGFATEFSPDGAFLYYSQAVRYGWPRGQGLPQIRRGWPRIHDKPMPQCDRCFAPWRDGVFIVHASADRKRTELRFYHSAGGGDLITFIAGGANPGLSVSGDGRYVLLPKWTRIAAT